jgi:outer membrane PBP1 activator LpoA protein
MQIKMLKGVFASAGLALLGACSTPMPCDPTGGLCAPIQANTSAAAAVPAPVVAAPKASVQTMPVESPGTPAVAPAPSLRLGLLLPTRSEALGPPAAALRAGFMAAHARAPDGVQVNLIDSSDDTDETLTAYMMAKKDNDIIVGPLSRAAVGVLAASGTVSLPTIALNHPDGRSIDNPIPPKMLVIGLSIEEQARSVAQWAAAEHPGATALVVSGNSAWQRRLAAAFSAQWKQLGYPLQQSELTASGGYLAEPAIHQLKMRVDAEPPGLLFAALDADQLRQVRAILGTELPAYGASSVNPGLTAGNSLPELDGLRLLDMPWQLLAEQSFPRYTAQPHTADMDRLYALGIDAYRVALEVARKPNSALRIDGVTGRLTVTPVNGGARFERIETGAVYQTGSFTLVERKK